MLGLDSALSKRKAESSSSYQCHENKPVISDVYLNFRDKKKMCYA